MARTTKTGRTARPADTPTRGDRQLALGRTGEDLAVARLEAEGMVVLDRNVRCREGEIDIIARDGATIVFVEVKTRRTMRQGSPLEAITPVKLRRIRMLSGLWLREQAEFYPATRIDAIGIVMSPRPTVTHVRNVQVDA
ncbi:YraN family protein [Brevibacterium casei]|uniref:YraN family protein n=1 Tax=Brevibacterium casei TaxID=33889 RepID=UPI001CE64D35|nr:YraN family protein [Brevibacterium casei]MCT2181713.1 YraN family protein [Brevibacterium casei]QZE24837.1 YraN family protein [Brevibacterium casei]